MLNYQTQNRSDARPKTIDWRSILKNSAQEVYKDDEQGKFPLDYALLPDKRIQKKIDFFFLPYNYE